jgi:hypothetical protein
MGLRPDLRDRSGCRIPVEIPEQEPEPVAHDPVVGDQPYLPVSPASAQESARDPKQIPAIAVCMVFRAVMVF